MILATQTSDNVSIDELLNERGCRQLEIQSLNMAEKHSLTKVCIQAHNTKVLLNTLSIALKKIMLSKKKKKLILNFKKNAVHNLNICDSLGNSGQTQLPPSVRNICNDNW